VKYTRDCTDAAIDGVAVEPRIWGFLSTFIYIVA